MVYQLPRLLNAFAKCLHRLVSSQVISESMRTCLTECNEGCPTCNQVPWQNVQVILFRSSLALRWHR